MVLSSATRGWFCSLAAAVSGAKVMGIIAVSVVLKGKGWMKETPPPLSSPSKREEGRAKSEFI
jgi:hypothetical protein